MANDASAVLGLMTLHVQSKMIGASEASFAGLAAEGFGARVLAHVTGQLVGASKAPLAAREVAPVRSLTCKDRK